MGLDEIILGRKRDPKTFISEEWWHATDIIDVINSMSLNLKKQLALAIFMSQINGDESLHLGQFMVSQNENGEITKIQRVDMGALSRFAFTRSEHNPLKTSPEYKASGQFQKDYIHYLVQDNDVKKELLKLWTIIDVDKVVEQVGKRFDQQIQHFEDNNLKEEALSGFYKTLIKGSEKGVRRALTHAINQDLSFLEQNVRDMLIMTTKKRCTEMQTSAFLHLRTDDLPEMEAPIYKALH
jgi:hypothetical protein